MGLQRVGHVWATFTIRFKTVWKPGISSFWELPSLLRPWVTYSSRASPGIWDPTGKSSMSSFILTLTHPLSHLFVYEHSSSFLGHFLLGQQVSPSYWFSISSTQQGVLSFKPVFSLFSFTHIKWLFSSSSLSAMCYHLHIWGYWYFSWQSWFQFVIHPAQYFTW